MTTNSITFFAAVTLTGVSVTILVASAIAWLVLALISFAAQIRAKVEADRAFAAYKASRVGQAIPNEDEGLFVMVDGAPAGPLGAREIRDLLKLGQITWQTQAAAPGADEWVPLSAFSGQLAESKRPSVEISDTAMMHGRTLEAVGSGMRRFSFWMALTNPIAGIGAALAARRITAAGRAMRGK